MLLLFSAFIRKVYSILTAQLLVTTLVCALFLSIQSLKSFAQNRYYLKKGVLTAEVNMLKFKFDNYRVSTSLFCLSHNFVYLLYFLSQLGQKV